MQLVPRSDIQDYMLRGSQLDEFSFLQFVVDTYEEPIPAAEHKKNAEDLEETVETVSTFSKDTMPRPRGRPRHVRSHYLEEHPKHEIKRRIVRREGHNTLPNIVGPYFPRNNDPMQRPFYCASMLALLKPWRELRDLKLPDDTSESTFDQFLSIASQSTRNVIAGIQYYYDCKKTADDKSTEQIDPDRCFTQRDHDQSEEDYDDDDVDIDQTETQVCTQVTGTLYFQTDTLKQVRVNRRQSQLLHRVTELPTRRKPRYSSRRNCSTT